MPQKPKYPRNRFSKLAERGASILADTSLSRIQKEKLLLDLGIRVYPHRTRAQIIEGVRELAERAGPSIWPVANRGSGIDARASTTQSPHPSHVAKSPGERDRNPPWSRDELILALDLYLYRRISLPGKESAEVAELSEVLNRLTALLSGARSSTFRNVNGVYMKLMNFRSLDPHYTSQGKVGLTSIGKADRAIWDEFSSEPTKCHEIAQALLAGLLLSENGEMRDAINSLDDDGEMDAPEGRLLTRIHFSRERNRQLVAQKKASVLKCDGLLACEACGFDFSKKYGTRGEGFIECHHTRPLAEMGATSRTKLADLALLCANCHRMIHLRRPWLTIEALKKLIVS